jgi:hypothetical protein
MIKLDPQAPPGFFHTTSVSLPSVRPNKVSLQVQRSTRIGFSVTQPPGNPTAVTQPLLLAEVCPKARLVILQHRLIAARYPAARPEDRENAAQGAEVNNAPYQKPNSEAFSSVRGIAIAAYSTIFLNAASVDVRISGAQKTVTCPGRARTNQGREGKEGTYTDGPDVNILVGVLGIGNVGLASIQGEAYNAIGQQVKAKSPMTNTVFVGLANGQAYSGFIPTDDAFGRYTFQVLGSRLKPGCAETSIRDALVEMLTQYSMGLSVNQ